MAYRDPVEPLAGAIRRLLTGAGYRPAEEAGYGRTVTGGFQIAALLSDTLPPSPVPDTFVVWHRPRYDQALSPLDLEAKHHEYGATLIAAGFDVVVSPRDVLVRVGRP